MLSAVREAVMARGPAVPVVEAEPMPFIEIGGPDGLVSSIPAPVKPSPVLSVAAAPIATSTPTLASAPVPASTPVAASLEVAEAVAFPRLAQPEAAFVSVAFHDLTARAKPTPRTEGLAADLVAFHFPNHPVSLEYQSLRDEIASQLAEGVPQAVLFTAAAADAGTTTVLLNLAITLARDTTNRVLVVDANVGRPSISARLGVKGSPGLVETLSGQLPLAWAIQPAPVPNLQVLAAGIGTNDTPASFTEEFPKLLSQLRQWYDWVLIDGGVWGEMPERDAACPGADAVYLVTRDADTTRAEFEGLRGWVKQLGGLLRGFVTTRI